MKKMILSVIISLAFTPAMADSTICGKLVSTYKAPDCRDGACPNLGRYIFSISTTLKAQVVTAASSEVMKNFKEFKGRVVCADGNYMQTHVDGVVLVVKSIRPAVTAQ